MGEDFERERQDYFDNISGVGEWQGQKFRWSRWAWDIAYHPAMLGRRRGGIQPSRWDPLKPVLLLGVVIGIPALIVFYTTGGMRLGAKLAIVLGPAAVLTVIFAFAIMWTAGRARRDTPKPFPHPGPKGRHKHR